MKLAFQRTLNIEHSIAAVIALSVELAVIVLNSTGKVLSQLREIDAESEWPDSQGSCWLKKRLTGDFTIRRTEAEEGRRVMAAGRPDGKLVDADRDKSSVCRLWKRRGSATADGVINCVDRQSTEIDWLIAAVNWPRREGRSDCKNTATLLTVTTLIKITDFLTYLLARNWCNFVRMYARLFPRSI